MVNVEADVVHNKQRGVGLGGPREVLQHAVVICTQMVMWQNTVCDGAGSGRIREVAQDIVDVEADVVHLIGDGSHKDNAV